MGAEDTDTLASRLGIPGNFLTVPTFAFGGALLSALSTSLISVSTVARFPVASGASTQLLAWPIAGLSMAAAPYMRVHALRCALRR